MTEQLDVTVLSFHSAQPHSELLHAFCSHFYEVPFHLPSKISSWVFPAASRTLIKHYFKNIQRNEIYNQLILDYILNLVLIGKNLYYSGRVSY